EAPKNDEKESENNKSNDENKDDKRINNFCSLAENSLNPDEDILKPLKLINNCTAGESIKIDHLAENCTADETSSSKFESRIYPWGVSENIKTPALTIKSIRKLRNNEHKMVNYEQNSPYEVEVEEEIVYENGVSHLIWFFANADYVKNRPPVYNKSAPILYYFL
ncbi:3651_t:CDS:2, partial [Scutellospora calospora]